MCNAVDTFKQNRNGSAKQELKAVSTTSVQLAPRDPNRIAIVIGPGSGAILWLGLGVPAVAFSGMFIPNQGNPLILSMALHGQIVQEAIYGVVDAGNITIGVWTATRWNAWD